MESFVTGEFHIIPLTCNPFSSNIATCQFTGLFNSTQLLVTGISPFWLSGNNQGLIMYFIFLGHHIGQGATDNYVPLNTLNVLYKDSVAEIISWQTVNLSFTNSLTSFYWKPFLLIQLYIDEYHGQNAKHNWNWPWSGRPGSTVLMTIDVCWWVVGDFCTSAVLNISFPNLIFLDSRKSQL